MGIIKFSAQVAHASKEEDFYMVGFSDDKNNYENYIILQRAFEFDTQDIESGMNGEYVELNGQENSGYKCCRNAFISKDSFVLEIQFSSEEIYCVEISLSDVEISKELIQYLKEILGDKLEVRT